jgi:hypothetical protein
VYGALELEQPCSQVAAGLHVDRAAGREGVVRDVETPGFEFVSEDLPDVGYFRSFLAAAVVRDSTLA